MSKPTTAAAAAAAATDAPVEDVVITGTTEHPVVTEGTPETEAEVVELSPVQLRNKIRQELADAQHALALDNIKIAENRDKQVEHRTALTSLRTEAEGLRDGTKAARDKIAELRASLKA